MTAGLFAATKSPRIRGSVQVQEGLAQPRVVHETGLGRPRGLPDRRRVEPERRGRHQEGAAAEAIVRAHDTRQERHRPDGLAALGRARHPLAEPDEGRPRATVQVRQPLDVGRRHAGDRGHAGGIEARQHLALEALEPERLPREIVAIAEAVAREHVHEAERQGGVAADVHAHVPVRALRRLAAPRLDDHELGAGMPRALDERPDMEVGRHQVRAPGDDEVGVHHRLGIGASDAAARRVPARLRARVAHRARLQTRDAERVEEAEEQAAIDLALVCAIRVAEQREGPILADDGLPAADDLVERLGPGDRREAPLALGAGAAQRRRDAIRRVDRLVLAVHLGAHEARGHHVIGVALQLRQPPVLDVRRGASTGRDSRARTPSG